MRTAWLFPGIRGLRVGRVWTTEGRIQVRVETYGSAGCCPRCGRCSRHVHSHYERTLADCPWTGQALTLQVRVRRFRCRVRGCPQRVFTERLPSLARPWGRRTERQRRSLQRHGVDLGGEAGARHCQAEALGVSARTLLRLVRQIPLPVATAVRILGVDDWSQRRGQSYGTILVNLETHQVIDLLPDRTAETLVAWLRGHPEIEVISRDRAGAYAEGARVGAPQATQVADRFHLLKNVSEALKRYLLRQHRSLRQAALEAQATPPDSPGEDAGFGPRVPPTQEGSTSPQEIPVEGPLGGRPPAPPNAGLAQPTQASRTRRLARYEEVMALHRLGTSARAIAAATGLSRATVNTFVQAGDFPERAPRAAGVTHLTPFLDYLRERWASGCQNASLLWRDLRERGFRGALSAVTRYLRSWRTVPRRSHHATTAALSHGPLAAVRASPRATCWLLLADPERLMGAEQRYLTSLCRLSPQVALAQALAREFHTVIRERDLPGLYQWLHGAKLSGLAEFTGVTNGIWRDRRAVEAALTHTESQGQTEGFVNKLKFLKRSGYGRAGFDLLWRRVLLAS